MNGNGKKTGQNLPVADGLIAATAIHHGLIVVTDNGKHFSLFGAEVVNPWRI